MGIEKRQTNDTVGAILTTRLSDDGEVRDSALPMRLATAHRSKRLAASVARRGGLRGCGTQLGSIYRVSIETASVSAIDMRSIRQLAEGDEQGEQFVTEIIGVFLGDLSERVGKIGLQMTQGDHAGIAATAHAIKGSGGHFGAASLLELSSQVEARARREPTDGLQAAIDSMIAETERVRAALEAYLADHAVAV
jgi:HPt (histidine-containing phosphotransfer) domain-containing protein